MQSSSPKPLNLKAGEYVRVRSREEILATLDDRGCLENVPFMPEMVHFCGQPFRVSARADKTCDPANAPWTIRRLTDAVHLEGIRCDGAAHDGCQAGCLIFWKEAWLERSSPDTVTFPSPSGNGNHPHSPARTQLLTVDELLSAGKRLDPDGEPRYFCQATEVRNFTSFMKSWDPRQYIRDIRSRNLFTEPCPRSRSNFALELILAVIKVLQAVIISTAWSRRGILYPSIVGKLQKTPIEALDLQPGELVRVRPKEEIEATLDTHNKNRGLLFDTEMVPYCGGIYRVLRRVHRIVDEKTGKMMNMRHPCIVLEGVVCKSDFHRLCPRAIYSYWRESWLTRVPVPVASLSRQYPTESVGLLKN